MRPLGVVVGWVWSGGGPFKEEREELRVWRAFGGDVKESERGSCLGSGMGDSVAGLPHRVTVIWRRCCSKKRSSFSTSKELKSCSEDATPCPGNCRRKMALDSLTSFKFPPPLPSLLSPPWCGGSIPPLLAATALWNLCLAISSPLHTKSRARGTERLVHFASSSWVGRYFTSTSCIC